MKRNAWLTPTILLLAPRAEIYQEQTNEASLEKFMGRYGLR